MFRFIRMSCLARRFVGARRAVAAVEFAITGLALFTFLLGIVNLGDLGLVLGAMQRGVQGAARQAAVTAANNLSSSTACPTSANIQSYFNGYASPPLATGSAHLSGATWVNNGAASSGSYLVLTATYAWAPIGLTPIWSGFNLSLTAAAFVMGSSATVHC